MSIKSLQGCYLRIFSRQNIEIHLSDSRAVDDRSEAGVDSQVSELRPYWLFFHHTVRQRHWPCILQAPGQLDAHQHQQQASHQQHPAAIPNVHYLERTTLSYAGRVGLNFTRQVNNFLQLFLTKTN